MGHKRYEVPQRPVQHIAHEKADGDGQGLPIQPQTRSVPELIRACEMTRYLLALRHISQGLTSGRPCGILPVSRGVRTSCGCGGLVRPMQLLRTVLPRGDQTLTREAARAPEITQLFVEPKHPLPAQTGRLLHRSQPRPTKTPGLGFGGRSKPRLRYRKVSDGSLDITRGCGWLSSQARSPWRGRQFRLGR
jgi:hypothetical protein